MNEKIKNIVNSILFICIIVGIFILNIISQDIEISTSERRKLAQIPKISISNLKKGTFTDDFENYAMDQFILREEFRSIKTFMQLDVFKQKDNNSLYIYDDYIIKQEKLNEKSVENAMKKIENIYDKYLNGMNVYYSIIPDKAYFTTSAKDYIGIDYEKMKENIKTSKDITYIDIFETLDIEDYYKTDTHWRQEKLSGVVDKIAKEMNFKERLNQNYISKQIDDFYGVYYGQLAYNMKPETIIYLTNDVIEAAEVYNYETDKITGVYDLQDNMDKYDVFLSGAEALLKITNPNATTEKELIIFRDSFGSSIAPLLIEAYSTITLVDIRYINSSELDKFIDFKNQDVLFLYSTLILNNSYSLK